mgnify:CR=1 FL=1
MSDIRLKCVSPYLCMLTNLYLTSLSADHVYHLNVRAFFNWFIHLIWDTNIINSPHDLEIWEIIRWRRKFRKSSTFLFLRWRIPFHSSRAGFWNLYMLLHNQTYNVTQKITINNKVLIEGWDVHIHRNIHIFQEAKMA